MSHLRHEECPSITSIYSALQHEPRPLPLFLALLRNQTAADPQATAAALAGLRAYQAAQREQRPPSPPAFARAGRTVLRDFGGEGRPVVVVPSLINPPDILDLALDNSLLRWLARKGVRPLLVEWGHPEPGERDLDVAGHVETMLLPLLDAVGKDAALVGYCLGGTMAVAAAQLRPVDRLAMIASPWRFSGYPGETRLGLGDLWATSRPAAERLGLFPMELLQAGFWRLDPTRVIAKYTRFGQLAQNSDAARAFVVLEDWANAGSPLTVAAGRDLAETFMRDDLPGTARWVVGGSAIDPARLDCPVLEVVSSSDRIVPAATAAGTGRRLDLAQGHVGMVIGARARTVLWEPLAAFLAGAPAA